MAGIPETKIIGDLEAIHVPGDPDGPYIVMIHGFGANMSDLFSLHKILPDHPEVNWIFPNGFLDVPLGAWGTGKAWFPVDMDELAKVMWSDRQEELTQHRPDGMDEAHQRLRKLLEALGVPLSQVVLGGFSQGAALAVELALTAEETPAGLVILSTMLLDEPNWKAHADARAGLPFFQSHGRSDPLVAVSPAEELARMLQAHGLVGDIHMFDGGHEIPPDVITHMLTYLYDRLASIKTH